MSLLKFKRRVFTLIGGTGDITLICGVKLIFLLQNRKNVG